MWQMEHHMCDSCYSVIVADGMATLLLADVIAMADGIAIEVGMV